MSRSDPLLSTRNNPFLPSNDQAPTTVRAPVPSSGATAHTNTYGATDSRSALGGREPASSSLLSAQDVTVTQSDVYLQAAALASQWLSNSQQDATGMQPSSVDLSSYFSPPADSGLAVRGGASDTKQGDNFGDCGVIAAINSVAATQPGLIQNKIKPLAPDAQGNARWDVKLFKDGAWRHYEVSAGDRAAATGKNGTNYGPIYESAIGKALGGFNNAKGQWTQNMVKMITGMPMVNNEGKGAQRDTLNAVQRGATAVCEYGDDAVFDRSTGVRVGGAANAVGPNQVKIQASHAYSVTSVTGNAPNRLVTVQNPHNEGPGSEGEFTLTEPAFCNIFGKSGYAGARPELRKATA